MQWTCWRHLRGCPPLRLALSSGFYYPQLRKSLTFQGAHGTRHWGVGCVSPTLSTPRSSYRFIMEGYRVSCWHGRARGRYMRVPPGSGVQESPCWKEDWQKPENCGKTLYHSLKGLPARRPLQCDIAYRVYHPGTLLGAPLELNGIQCLHKGTWY